MPHTHTRHTDSTAAATATRHRHRLFLLFNSCYLFFLTRPDHLDPKLLRASSCYRRLLRAKARRRLPRAEQSSRPRCWTRRGTRRGESEKLRHYLFGQAGQAHGHTHGHALSVGRRCNWVYRLWTTVLSRLYRDIASSNKRDAAFCVLPVPVFVRKAATCRRSSRWAFFFIFPLFV